MRLQIVSPYFPPHNTIGALRVGKLARFLHGRGHALRVLSASEASLAKTLPLEIPEEEVLRVRRLNVNFLPELFLGGSRTVARRGYSTRVGPLRRLGRIYRTLFNVPDAFVGWLPFAVHHGTGLARSFRPDLLYTSACPWSALVATAMIHRRTGIPWVAELRDPWTDGPLYDHPSFRRKLDRLVERWALSSASAMVSVTEPWAEALARSYSVPVLTMRNGFDPRDVAAAVARRLVPPETLNVVHTGLVLPPPLDHTASFFEGLARLGPAAEGLRVTFVGTKQHNVMAHAEAHGLAHLVQTHESVPHMEALGLQRGADLLLLLTGRRDCYPGKLFEYAGSRRPILNVGSADNLPARLVATHGLGTTAFGAEEIASYMRSALAEFEGRGSLPPMSKASLKGLTRDEQFEKLEPFLTDVLARRKGE